MCPSVSPSALIAILSPPSVSTLPASSSSLTFLAVPLVPQVSFVVQVPSSTNIHPTITRSKDGIFKPIALATRVESNESKFVAKPIKPSK